VALDDLGSIPPAMVFAGQTLEPPWDGGSLFRCRRCHLVFRHPIRSDDEYEHLYERASESVWVSGGELRTDQRLVRARIESACTGAGHVLDVGCYDGTLLASLAPRFHRYGIEASAMAAQVARQKGVEIVGTRIRDLASITERFDAVSAVDVIEHLSNPRAFIAMLAGRLSAEGTLLISTGSTDTPAWRFAGGRYWYCAFPEHISFISPAWARAAAAELNLDVVDIQRFAYTDIDTRSRTRARRRYYRKLMQERIGQSIRAWLPGAATPSSRTRSHGQPGLFDDHILVTFRRRDARAGASRAAG
jgi:2-polyprenyl-3-methyl-5-hydroxy-6-metoxy-1,4-benzoquinol methylase